MEIKCVKNVEEKFLGAINICNLFANVSEAFRTVVRISSPDSEIVANCLPEYTPPRPRLHSGCFTAGSSGKLAALGLMLALASARERGRVP